MLLLLQQQQQQQQQQQEQQEQEQQLLQHQLLLLQTRPQRPMAVVEKTAAARSELLPAAIGAVFCTCLSRDSIP